jgi:hypothetical protein
VSADCPNNITKLVNKTNKNITSPLFIYHG